MKKIKITTIIILLSVSLILGGCKDPNEEKAEKQVAIFLDGYQKQDESISKLLLGTSEADYMSFEGISRHFANELKYKIKSCKKEQENFYNVEVEVETINFERLFSDSYQETIEKYGEEGILENFLKVMEENISEKEYESNKIVCNVIVRKLNDEYRIQMDSSLANALTGGMNEYLNLLQGGK